ncbi:uridine diphosphate glucose pyrophosphatase NUDT22 isoform X2 [Heterodontus francisci]|uniref:uridine diphosphate glucose pyrophosphatase NUDT22 isoform X2 n=1 Tax=Heterodontus francisci TaxID=7792 RepID=UPI00355ACF27
MTMDPDISIMVQCPFMGELTQDQVQVEISSEHNRRVLLGHEQKIAEIWKQRCQETPWLFNGAKFRIRSAELASGALVLRLGLTCYKDYLGTNWSADAPLLQRQGLADFGDSQAYLADPLGVGAMLHTADDCFVFLRRSDQVAEAAGQVDIPGGHPEPKVNVPLESLSRPVLLGIARNNKSAARASAEFYVRCKLTSEEVRQHYLIGGPEAHESTGIIIIRREDVLKLDEDAERWRELCPSAKGGVKLYSLVRPRMC